MSEFHKLRKLEGFVCLTLCFKPIAESSDG